MRLTRLTISMNPSYAKNPGLYTGEVEYEGESSKFSLTLTPVISERVLAAVADAAEEGSLQMMQQLRGNIQQSIAEAQHKMLNVSTTSE